ncbi:MAG: hypothetical protein ACR2L2_19475 [Acidobacteriota bacterium]
MKHRNGNFLTLALVLVCLSTSASAAAPNHKAWLQTIQDLSEPGGYFDSDNLVSNESSYLTVLSKLGEYDGRGGAYIGVGPDQNFTYIARMRPEVALIIDIRRQNMIQHLLFKALMDLSGTRLQFLSLLFARPVKRLSDRGAAALTLPDLLKEIDASAADSNLYRKTLARIKATILVRYGFPATLEDLQGLEHIYESFHQNGPELRYRSFGRAYQLRYPSYRELLLEKDLQGNHAHYLNSESDYRWLREFQRQNRLIPIVGDLAGPKAVRAIGEYLRSRSLLVSAFYVSNVEFYLLRYTTFDAFVENLATLPVGPNSLLVRSYFGYGRHHPEQVFPYRMATLLQRIPSFLSEHRANPYRNYWELAVRDYISIVPENLRSAPFLYAPP